MTKGLTKKQQKEIDKEVDKQIKKTLKVEEKKLEKEIEQKLHKKFFSKSKQTATFLHSKFKDHASTAIIAALSFLIALAWRDLIVKLVKESIKISAIEKYPYLLELYTALIITVIAIVGIVVVSKWAQKPDTK